MLTTAIPTRFDASPHFQPLPAGTRLWRVHDQRYQATGFNPRTADTNFGGGRFDGTDRDPYPTYYAGLGPETALAEALLRAIPFNDQGVRRIPRVSVRNRRLSTVETTGELALVDLCSGPALAAVAQDSWLIHAEAADYHATRRWASWIRDQAPKAQGLIWPSKREVGRRILVLFGDRCSGEILVERSPGRDLDDLEGAVTINRLLAPYGAVIAAPAGRPARR